jgi:hypothetical protein
MYGVGPSPSLDMFHDDIIRKTLNLGFTVVLKPHPSMLKDKDFTAKDRQYYQNLLTKWKAYMLGENIMKSKVNDSVYFVDVKLSVLSLNEVFPNFCCITQHGTVASECAAIGNFSIVANNSKYFYLDKFVNILEELTDLHNLLKIWSEFEQYTEEQLSCLYKFVYVNYKKCSRLYASNIFRGIFPEDLDSSNVESWLKSFENHSEVLLQSCCDDNITNLNNNLIDVID